MSLKRVTSEHDAAFNRQTGGERAGNRQQRKCNPRSERPLAAMSYTAVVSTALGKQPSFIQERKFSPLSEMRFA